MALFVETELEDPWVNVESSFDTMVQKRLRSFCRELVELELDLAVVSGKLLESRERLEAKYSSSCVEAEEIFSRNYYDSAVQGLKRELKEGKLHTPLHDNRSRIPPSEQVTSPKSKPMEDMVLAINQAIRRLRIQSPVKILSCVRAQDLTPKTTLSTCSETTDCAHDAGEQKVGPYEIQTNECLANVDSFWLKAKAVAKRQDLVDNILNELVALFSTSNSTWSSFDKSHYKSVALDLRLSMETMHQQIEECDSILNAGYCLKKRFNKFLGTLKRTQQSQVVLVNSDSSDDGDIDVLVLVGKNIVCAADE